MPATLEARERAARCYLDGTESAAIILGFLLDQLTPIAESTGGLYVHQVGEIAGQLRKATDRKGRIGFAFYPKKSPAAAGQLSFRRNRRKFPRAARRNFHFLPAPVLWAQLNGIEVMRLESDAFQLWRRSLERYANVQHDNCPLDRAVHLARVDANAKFPLPSLPLFGVQGDKHGTKVSLERVLGRRLQERRLWWLWASWVFFCSKWSESMQSTQTELPRCVRAAEAFVASGIGASRAQARGAMEDLQRLGLLRAALYVPSPVANRRGTFAYLPGRGVASCAQRLRHPHITPRETLHAMREFIRGATERRQHRDAARTQASGVAAKQPNKHLNKGIAYQVTTTSSKKTRSRSLYGDFPESAADAWGDVSGEEDLC